MEPGGDAPERRAERAQRRRSWVGTVATDAISGMLGTLLAAGVVVLFGSLIGAIHGISNRERLWILGSTLPVVIAIGFFSYGVRIEAAARRDSREAADLLERYAEEVVARARKRDDDT